MTAERRYRDEEVRKIFGLATRPGSDEHASRANADGLTLAEIQDIGREVGVAPAALARAAESYEVQLAHTGRRTSLGMPVEVRRTVDLPRLPTDAEWSQLVAELRTTFRARGRVTAEGGVREWVNGNLHASIEPAAQGYRLRIGTIKGNAAALNGLGVAGIVTGIITFGGMLLTGALPEALFVSSAIAASGSLALMSNLVRLPRWSKERESQMEHIAQRARILVQAHVDDAPEQIEGTPPGSE